jgi:small subunit ribosomal protein S20|tara:strand:- start:186 stop:449 length:264 start_codon:yes stop_codon:yes gene_type:complete
MANLKSAKKRIRQTARKTGYNRVSISKIRGSIKKTELLITGSKKEEAKTSFSKLQSAISKGVKKGVMKRGTASRKISRLSAKIKAIK